MPENDEPLDDARAVAMNAAAAAARVAETVIRDQQQRARDRTPALDVPDPGWGPATREYMAEHPVNDEQSPGHSRGPERTREQLQEDERQIRRHNAGLTSEPASETTVSSSDYDSPSRRAAADAEMAAAGVPAEIRNARNVSDVLNGTDPSTAAAAGTKARPRARTGSTRADRERTR